MLHVLFTTLIQTGFAVERPPVPEGMDLEEPTPAMCRRSAGTPIGLTTASISQGFNSVMSSISSCFEQESGSLDATVTIGCDGVVQDVEAYDGSGLAPTAIACIMDTLYYASFAPHDAPDGQVVAMGIQRDGISLHGAGTFKDNSLRAIVVTAQQETQSPTTDQPSQGLVTSNQGSEEINTTLLDAGPNPEEQRLAATSTTCDDITTQQACEGDEDPKACTLWATALLDRSDSCYNAKGARDLLLTICTGVSSPHTACLKLGMLYQEGEGGERDRTKAASYFRWGCRGGNPEACFARGVLLERGIGIQRDDELALVSHESGCQLGDLRSCFHAATILNEGTFVTRDVRRAAKLFHMTCDSGDPDGCLQLGLLQQSMRPAEYNAAHTNFEKAIQGGSHEAMRHLARLLWNGLGSRVDKRQAKLLCREACQLGDPLACRGPQYL